MLVHRMGLRETSSWCWNPCSEAGALWTEAEWEDKEKKKGMWFLSDGLSDRLGSLFPNPVLSRAQKSVTAREDISSLDIGWKACSAKIGFLTYFFFLKAACWLRKLGAGKSIRDFATLGSTLTDFHFFNKYLLNTQHVPGMVPTRHKPVNEVSRHTIGIPWMHVEECRNERVNIREPWKKMDTNLRNL